MLTASGHKQTYKYYMENPLMITNQRLNDEKLALSG